MGYREILAALADETRRGILQELRRGRRSAGELAEALGVSPQAPSYGRGNQGLWTYQPRK